VERILRHFYSVGPLGIKVDLLSNPWAQQSRNIFTSSPTNEGNEPFTTALWYSKTCLKQNLNGPEHSSTEARFLFNQGILLESQDLKIFPFKIKLRLRQVLLYLYNVDEQKSNK
jgi:hypothetical protein